MRRIVRALVPVRWRLAAYHVRRAIVHAREVALAPSATSSSSARLRFDPRRFAHSLLGAARAAGGNADSIIAPLPASALPTGERSRILHLIDGLTLGGSQRLLCDIVRGLGDVYDMDIVTSGVDPKVQFGNMPIHVAHDHDALRHIVGARRPALIHLHYWGRTSWVERAIAVSQTCWPGVGVIQNGNSPVPNWIDSVFCHYVYVSRYALELQSDAGTPASVIYPGVDTEEYRPASATGDAIGLVYRLEDDKLAPDALEVLIAVARSRSEARVVVVGAGSRFDDWVARTRQAGVRAQFHFTGLVPFDALPAIYDRFALYCAPVRAESYGLVVPYAMAKDIPVCGFRTGALPEILGEDAMLVDHRDELVALIDRLLADRATLARAGLGGRQRVLERFSLAAMLAAYRELYARYDRSQVGHEQARDPVA